MTPTAKKLLSLLIQSGSLDWYKIFAELGDTKAAIVEVVEGDIVKLTPNK